MNQQLIKAIHIEKLFGLYTYDFNHHDIHDDAVILYGDNGVGKSTILRLAFHLLSSANDKGHRTALYETNFKKLQVELTSGVVLLAEHTYPKNSTKILVLSILDKGVIIARWNHSPRDGDRRRMIVDDEIIIVNENEQYEMEYIRKSLDTKSKKNDPLMKVTGHRLYLSKLERVTPVTFILNADRRLDGDMIGDPDDEVEFRQAMRFDAPKRLQDLVLRSREIALSQALNAATKWIARKAVQGTNQGSDNVHSTYVRILKHIVSPSIKSEVLITDRELVSLRQRLRDIGDETVELAKYELATVLDMSEFERVLSTQSGSQSSLSADLLTPYVESLDGRLGAVRSIYKILDRFISTINELLTDKKIGFHLSQGFFIKNKYGEKLEPSQLSSGEQQLLLLFCYVLVARDVSSIFMIDEPEISLNIKWQRTLIQSLLNITEGASIQFIFASHSMEILAQHHDRVVTLVNENE